MDAVEAHVLALYDQGERERLERLQRQWDYYHGDPARPLRVQPNRPDDNVLFDLPRQLVDTSVAFLFGDDLDITPDSESDAEESPLHEWLEDCYRHASPGGDALLFQRLAVNGGVTGHAHAKIQTTDDGKLRVVVLDPQAVRAKWHPDDVEDIVEYTITWTTVYEGKPAARRQVITRADTKQSWEIVDEVSVGADALWKELSRVTWAYPFAPVVQCQNLPCPNEYYGLADLEPSLLDLCDAVNRVASHVAKLVRVHGFPKTYTKGVGAVEEIQLGMDTILQLPSDTAEIGYLHNPGDIAASLALYDRLKEALFEQARIPEVATGRLKNTGQLSGRALKIMYGPLVDKTEAKRRTYGHMIEDLSARLLVVGGKAADLEAAKCSIKWPEIVPSDPKEEAETLALHEELGVVSKETIAGKLGYDYAAERDLMDNEQASSMDNGITDPNAPPPMPMLPGQPAAPTVPPDESAGPA